MEDNVKASMIKIKAILFDLDGTLRHSLPTSGEVFLEHLKSIGLQVSEENRIRAEHWTHSYFAYSSELQSDLNVFKDDQKGFWINFTQRRLVASGIPPAKVILCCSSSIERIVLTTGSVVPGRMTDKGNNSAEPGSFSASGPRYLLYRSKASL